MIGSEKVRAARKKAHLERLQAKSEDNYAEFYANQPQQRIRAEANEQIRLAKLDLKAALEAVQIAEIEGKGLLACQEAHQIASLVLQKLEESNRPNARMVLGG